MIGPDVPLLSEPGERDEVWVVCRGLLREVREGIAACPIRASGAATLGECLACHLLDDASNDRDHSFCVA